MISYIIYNNKRLELENAIRLLKTKIEIYKKMYIDMDNFERSEVGKDIIYLMAQILDVAAENKKHNNRYRLPI